MTSFSKLSQLQLSIGVVGACWLVMALGAARRKQARAVSSVPSGVWHPYMGRGWAGPVTGIRTLGASNACVRSRSQTHEDAARACARTHTHTHTRAHTRAHTHTHTHFLSLSATDPDTLSTYAKGKPDPLTCKADSSASNAGSLCTSR